MKVCHATNAVNWLRYLARKEFCTIAASAAEQWSVELEITAVMDRLRQYASALATWEGEGRR